MTILDPLAVHLRAEVERLTRLEEDVFKSLNPECPAHPGIPNQCRVAACDCFGDAYMPARIVALTAEVDRLTKAAIRRGYANQTTSASEEPPR